MLGEIPAAPQQGWETMLGTMHVIAKVQNDKFEKGEGDEK